MVRIAAVCALAALAALTPPAHAEDTVIADGQGAAALSAYGGYLVFSRRDATTGRWALVRWHDGLETPLTLPYRAVPFDADAGPDAAGRPVVDYSRCATDPTTADEWLRARGCRIEELRLDAPAEPRAVPGTHARGSSETTPSRWGAAIAFARHGNRRFASQLRLLRDGARRSVALPGAPVRCLGGCGGRRIRTTVESLDLGARATAFVRRQNGGDTVGIDAEWFLQADPRDGAKPSVLSDGFVDGACGFIYPLAPTAVGRGAAWIAAGSPCEDTETVFAEADPAARRRRSAAAASGLIFDATRDGTTTYWLRVRPSRSDEFPSAYACVTAGTVCQVVRSERLPWQTAPSDEPIGPVPEDG